MKSKISLIIGLGNPGKKYQKTRHNIGWRVIDALAKKLKSTDFKEKKKLYALISRSKHIILAKPLTFMNNSGQSVKAIADYYQIPSQNIIVIHDEIDLPLGKIKLQKNIGSAGHKGVDSVINKLKTKDFKRIRIGIRPMRDVDVEKFVLGKFSQIEEKIIKKTIKKIIPIILASPPKE